jgi:hypothetical protein
MEELISYRNTKFVRLPISDGKVSSEAWIASYGSASSKKREYSILQTDL